MVKIIDYVTTLESHKVFYRCPVCGFIRESPFPRKAENWDTNTRVCPRCSSIVREVIYEEAEEEAE